MSAPATAVDTQSCGPIEVDHTSDGVVIRTHACVMTLSLDQALELLGAIAVHRLEVSQRAHLRPVTE